MDAGAWSPAVHEYLRYLEGARLDGSPRVLGCEDDREVLTFIDGDVAVDPQWEPGHGHRLPPYARTDGALRGAGDLLRRLHAAASVLVSFASVQACPQNTVPGHVAEVTDGAGPAVNARPQTWKACWGQPLRSSNLLSSAVCDQAKA
jgi:hypothetical protein